MEAMPFGRALQQILHQVWAANPRFGPVHLSKINIGDGFCGMWIHPRDATKLAVPFPNRLNESKLIAAPNVLPMGWKNLPPMFSTTTKTVADPVNNSLVNNQPQQENQLDELSETTTPPAEPTPAVPTASTTPKAMPAPKQLPCDDMAT